MDFFTLFKNYPLTIKPIDYKTIKLLKTLNEL
jgi:hypothetical protein